MRSDNTSYFAKLQKCHVCTEPCPQAELAREIGEDRLYKTQELVRLIKQIDSGELVPVVHGEWIFKHNPITDPKGYFVRIVCSECNLHTGQKSNYCPNCGADMRERKDND